MDRVLIIRNPKSDPAQNYTLVVDDERPKYFYDIKVAAEYIKGRIDGTTDSEGFQRLE